MPSPKKTMGDNKKYDGVGCTFKMFLKEALA
jgi:hypothetical protein